MMPAIAYLESLGLQRRTEEIAGIFIGIAVFLPALVFAGWAMRRASRGILQLIGKSGE